jgi:hypothetical protein
MEQTPSNTPVMEPKPGIAGWFSIWIKAVSKPSEQTYIDITESPEASTRTAYIWVFVVGTIAGLISAVLQTINSFLGVAPALPPIPGMENLDPSLAQGNSPIMILVIGLCVSPLAGLFSTLFFALFTAITQWIAKLFGGTGSYDKLLYAFAAITVPFTLVSSILSLFSAIPYIGACFGLISFGLSIYIIVLEVYAVKAINRFPSFGPAVGAVLIPVAVIFIFVCACIILFSFAFAGLLAGTGFAP